MPHLALDKTHWVTREGIRIKVQEMSDSHLINTLRFLWRRAKAEYNAELEAALDFESGLQGDCALYAMGCEIHRLVEDEDDWKYAYLEEDLPCFKLMVREAAKRGLDWEKDRGDER